LFPQRRKVAKFGGEDKIVSNDFIRFFSDLCGLRAFAGDIPSFGYGSAALGPSW
jgi:hypothetical protein